MQDATAVVLICTIFQIPGLDIIMSVMTHDVHVMTHDVQHTPKWQIYMYTDSVHTYVHRTLARVGRSVTDASNRSRVLHGMHSDSDGRRTSTSDCIATVVYHTEVATTPTESPRHNCYGIQDILDRPG